MKNLYASFITELMKQKRSAIFFVTIGLFIFIPLMMGLLMFIAQHPELEEKLGLIAAKASFFTENSWAGFFDVLNQMIAIIGLIGFGFVTAWIFGREYIEQTVKDLLALPVSRTSIVLSKFLVIILWCSLLTIIMLISSIIIGKIISIPGWSEEVITKSINKFLTTALLTLLLSTTVAFVASIGRGIIAAIGFVIFILIMAQFIAISGLGPYFPWAIPGIYTVSEGTDGMNLVFASYIILPVTSIAGLFGTIAWWRYADHH